MVQTGMEATYRRRLSSLSQTGRLRLLDVLRRELGTPLPPKLEKERRRLQDSIIERKKLNDEPLTGAELQRDTMRRIYGY